MKQKGFSLVELILVAAIFMIITSVVIFNQNRFSSDISISNISYQIALQIRQAQVYGTLVRQSANNFDVPYGVHFFKNTDSESSISFSVFADSDVLGNGVFGNGRYTPEDANVSTFSLSEGNTITEICLYSGSTASPSSCMNSVGESSQVDIVFRRPDPDAIISSDYFNNAQRAEIIVTSSLRDKQKRITVRNTGQISVDNVVQ